MTVRASRRIRQLLFSIRLFSACLRASPNSKPVHSVMLSSHLFFCLLFFVSPCWPAETEVMVSPLFLVCGSTFNCQTSVLGPVHNIYLVVDEDVKKPTKHTKLSLLVPCPAGPASLLFKSFRFSLISDFFIKSNFKGARANLKTTF